MCWKANAREGASIYYDTRGAGEQRHDLVVRYSQVEESRIVVKKQMPLHGMLEARGLHEGSVYAKFAKL